MKDSLFKLSVFSLKKYIYSTVIVFSLNLTSLL